MTGNQHENVNPIIASMKNSSDLDSKQISDTRHTFYDMYDYRRELFCTLCNKSKEYSWKSKKHFDEENDSMFNGCFVVGLDTPVGPITMHFKLEHWDDFDITELEYAPKYDGHNPKDDIRRIRVFRESKR